MVRLPSVGSDNGSWGQVLNEFLLQSHTSNGALQDNIVSENHLAVSLQAKVNSLASAPPDVDVRSFGAILDGVTNDRSALVNALNAAGIGGCVAIPHGKTLYIGSSGITLSSRRLKGGILKGSGAAALVSISGSGSVLENITIFNDAGTQAIAFTGNTTDVKITGCRIGGQSSKTGIGIQIDVTGVSNVLISECTFDLCGYGILTNANAPDLREVRIVNNRFTNISSDAIELNHPGTGYTSASQFSIIGNYISVTAGSGSTSGFGVGIAGATNVSIIGNQFGNCRLQAIHIEDEAAHISITGNTFTGSPLGVYVLDCDYLSIVGNAFYSQTNMAINFPSTSANLATHFSITGNTIRSSTNDGISVLSDSAAFYGVISNNVVSDCGGNGIRQGGTGTSYQQGSLLITHNNLSGNASYGIAASGGASIRIQGNITANNTAGSYSRTSVAAGHRIPLTDIQGQGSGTITGNYTAWVDLFSLGERASGTVFVTVAQQSSSSQRSQALLAITWDGSSLTQNYIGGTINNAATSAVVIRDSAGMLQARAFSTASDGTVALIWASLQGTVIV